MASAPEELSSIAILWNVPPGEPFPPEHHGKPVLVVAGAYAGSVEDGEGVVQPLREFAEPLVDVKRAVAVDRAAERVRRALPEGEFRYWKSRAFGRPDRAIAWGREFWAAMGKHSTGGQYLNFAGLGEETDALVRAGYGANYERLAELKAEYDPDEPLPHEPEHPARRLTAEGGTGGAAENA
jgi:hypothetical protein